MKEKKNDVVLFMPLSDEEKEFTELPIEDANEGKDWCGETKHCPHCGDMLLKDENGFEKCFVCGPLTLNEYQQKAMTTCLPSCENDMYMLLGLVEEVGELAGKVSKAIRKEQITIGLNLIPFSTFTEENFNELKGECGDVLWMLAGLCRQFGWTLEEVAQYNLDKLEKRKESGTIVTHTDH